MNFSEPAVKVSLPDVLGSFFTNLQAEQFYSYYRDNLRQEHETGENFKNYDAEGYEYLNRTQIDFLITFAENSISADNYLNLLLYLSKYASLSGEFLLSTRLYELVVKYCYNKATFNNFKANALYGLAEVYSRQAEWKKSFLMANQARRLFFADKDIRGAVSCENLIGTNYGERGELLKAVKHFEKCIDLLSGYGDSELKGRIEINLGIINNMLGKYDNALINYNRALISYQKLQNYGRIAEVRHNMGITLHKKENFEEAISEFDQAIVLSSKINYLQLLSFSYLQKAFVFLDTNDIVMADSFSSQSMEIALKINDLLTVAEVYRIKGIIQKQMKNIPLAKSYLETSLRLNRELQNKLNEAETMVELAILNKESETVNDSENYLEQAINYYKSVKANYEVEKLKNLMGSRK